MLRTATIIFYVSITTLALAQKLPPHVNLPELGLSFDIPSGWVGQMGGDAIIMGHHTIPGLMVIMENPSRNTTEMVQAAKQGIQERDIQLLPAGTINTKTSSRIEGLYQGTFQGSQVSAFAIGMIDGHGKGLSVLIIAEQALFNDQHTQAAIKLADSVAFYQAKDSPITQKWKQHLVGKQLKYMNTQGGSDYSGGYTGTSITRTIDLCQNGQFSFYDNSHASFSHGETIAGGMGFVNSNGTQHGNYDIYTYEQESILVLNFSGGRTVEYDLAVSAEKNTLLDNARYFMTQSEACHY